MNQRGFTLIELMVSVSIFIIVMTISLGALLSISASGRKAESVKTVMNNLSFAMESMTRTIRTGLNYSCNSNNTNPREDCPSTPENQITILAANGTTISYCLGSGSACLTPSTNTDCDTGSSCSIMRRIGTTGSYEPLTAPEINIRNFAFYVQGVLPKSTPDNLQPRVLITLDGVIQTIDITDTIFQLQTSVTQRLYDQ